MRSKATIIFLTVLLGLITINAKLVSGQTPPDKPIAATRPKTKKAPAHWKRLQNWRRIGFIIIFSSRTKLVMISV